MRRRAGTRSTCSVGNGGKARPVNERANSLDSFIFMTLSVVGRSGSAISRVLFPFSDPCPARPRLCRPPSSSGRGPSTRVPPRGMRFRCTPRRAQTSVILIEARSTWIVVFERRASRRSTGASFHRCSSAMTFSLRKSRQYPRLKQLVFSSRVFRIVERLCTHIESRGNRKVTVPRPGQPVKGREYL